MSDKILNIAVIGCGSWATTIAKVAAENGHAVSMWCHRDGIATEIQSQNTHTKVLPGVQLPKLKVSTDWRVVSEGADAVIIGLASSFFYQLDQMAFSSSVPILNLAKGLMKSGDDIFISDYLSAKFPNADLAMLSGPNIAKEIANRVPAASVVAAQNEQVGHFFQTLLSNDYFRVYRSLDVRGVEIGGVLKNVIAIAAGILDGFGFGTNTKSALITRGLPELSRVGERFNADPDTLFGLSGLGDLLTTCFSEHSRNRRFGEALVKCGSVQEATDAVGSVVEGINTTAVFSSFLKEDIESFPVVHEVNKILFEGKNPKESIQEFMTRHLKEE